MPIRIRTVAPSSQYQQEAYDKSKSRLLSQSAYRLIAESTLRPVPAFRMNGTDEERLAELEDALHDERCDVVWHSRGGYGLTRILPSLKLEAKKRFPLVIGFSDVTALLCHLWNTRSIKSIHGPVFTRIATAPQEALDALHKLIVGEAKSIAYPHFLSPGHRGTGEVSGTLIAGNLCMLSMLVGTCSMPSLQGALLFIEEVDEKAYEIDRLLTHLWAAGALIGLQGIVVGDLLQGVDGEKAPLEAYAVVRNFCKSAGILYAEGFPIGHGLVNWPLPFGARATIRLHSEKASLHIDEELV